MAETATPHDAVFKTFLSRVETARDFIELHLPPSLTQICKLDTLVWNPAAFSKTISGLTTAISFIRWKPPAVRAMSMF